MKKRDLLKKIEQLERRIDFLELKDMAQRTIEYAPYRVYPPYQDPYQDDWRRFTVPHPFQPLIWCDNGTTDNQITFYTDAGGGVAS